MRKSKETYILLAFLIIVINSICAGAQTKDGIFEDNQVLNKLEYYSGNNQGQESVDTFILNNLNNNNKVLKDYCVAPDIIYSHKEKKFYINPTCDGFENSTGHFIETFSSENLIGSKDEGFITKAN